MTPATKRKEAFDDALYISAVYEFGVNHQIIGIKGAQRDRPHA